MRISIIENIKGIYRETAIAANGSSGKNNGIEWFSTNSKGWPHVIIGPVLRNNIDEITQLIEQDKLPPFWVIVSDEAQPKLLEQHGYREVNRWEGMWLNKSNFSAENCIGNSLNIVEANTPQLVSDFWSVVQTALLPNKIIHLNAFNLWIESKQFILLTAYFNNQPVTTALAYFNGKVAGLYFIATLPQYQRKGFASILVSAIIEKSFAQGASEIVLHSSPAGQKMYEKLGFENSGQISTFWKVGKF